MDISIIYVYYKTPNEIKECINSILLHSKGFSFEIIVVDNNSQDNTEKEIRDLYPEIIWHQVEYNSGFSRANNIGIKLAKGDYILLLNTDTLFTENSILKCLEEYKTQEQSKNMGMLTCKTFFEDGTQQITAHPNFPSVKKILRSNPIYIFFNRNKKITAPGNVPSTGNYPNLAMPFGLVSKKAIEANNLYFDEDYFLYYEDTDWCYRATKIGLQNYYYSSTSILHLDGISSTNQGRRQKQIFLSSLLYFYKTRGLLYYIIYLKINLVNIILDELFYLKGKMLSKLNQLDVSQKESRRVRLKIILNRGLSIPFYYKRSLSSSASFLKY